MLQLLQEYSRIIPQIYETFFKLVRLTLMIQAVLIIILSNTEYEEYEELSLRVKYLSFSFCVVSIPIRLTKELSIQVMLS